ncbi:MAG TPA: relaxase/mobilization nuclease domain-containing protein [Corynebacteriales bacterium]|nr:relaxase/mobilization nuclease domain-containing protein [Mycobacteriales bacterium]
MAITKIHQINTPVYNSIAYITNPNKTDDLLLVSGYNCFENTAYIDFEITDNLAKNVKGDYTKTGGNDIKAHHIIQSFSLEDSKVIDGEKAHSIGKELANRLLKGKHEYIIATHIDRGHIHNHIIFNATSFYDLTKFNSQPYKTIRKIRNISDDLCMENELSVIKEPQQKGMHYAEWNNRKKGTSWKQQIENLIDKAIENTKTYEDFLKELKNYGVEIGNAFEEEGKHIKFRLKDIGQERFTRGRNEYTRDNIIERLKNTEKTIKKDEAINMESASYDKKIEWKSYNTKLAETKELASAITTIRNEKINNYNDFDDKISNLLNIVGEIKSSMKILDEKNIQYKNAVKYLVAYNDYLKYHEEYQKKGILTKQKYFNKYESEIRAFNHAVDMLNNINVNVNVDPDKVMNLVNEKDKEIDTMHSKINFIENRIEKIRNAKNLVDEINRVDKEKELNKSKDISI